MLSLDVSHNCLTLSKYKTFWTSLLNPNFAQKGLVAANRPAIAGFVDIKNPAITSIAEGVHLKPPRDPHQSEYRFGGG